jgi:CheY-like chemotaxis protein
MCVGAIAGPPRSVLIVDGYEEAATSLALVFSLNGHLARVASDADSALRAVTADRPDVVITDTVLPRISGFDFARSLASLPGKRPVLIALTGYVQASDRDAGRLGLFDHVLIKPADPAAIIDLVQATRTARP